MHIRNYRLYYLGQIISTSGTFMQSIAQAWLVLKLTDSGPAQGIVSALQSIILNGLSYSAVVTMLLLMHTDELNESPRLPVARGQFRGGLRYVLSVPVLRYTLIMLAIIGTLTFEFQVSLPLIAEFTFNAGASGYAFLLAGMGLGAVFGGLLIAGQKKTSPDKIVGAALLFGITLLAAAAMPKLFLAGATMVLVGMSSIYCTTLGNRVLQIESALR